MHLGKSSAAHIATVQLEERARVLAGLADSEPVDVEAVLQEHLALAGEAIAFKDALRAIVEELTDVGYEAKAGEQTRAAVKLYGEALDRLDRILTNISKLRIEERMAAVHEAHEIRLRLVLTTAMRQLGLDPADSAVARAVQSGIAETMPRSILGAR